MLYKCGEIRPKITDSREFQPIYWGQYDEVFPNVTKEGWIFFRVPKGIDLSQAKIHVSSPIKQYKWNVLCKNGVLEFDIGKVLVRHFVHIYCALEHPPKTFPSLHISFFVSIAYFHVITFISVANVRPCTSTTFTTTFTISPSFGRAS